MPSSKTNRKSILLSVRITPNARSSIEIEALKDGVTISEWIRHLIINELNERRVTSKVGFELKEV